MNALIPLTDIEKTFWFQNKLDKNDDSNNIIHKVVFDNTIPTSNLYEAVTTLLYYYPILTSNIKEIDGEPYFCVTEESKVLVCKNILELKAPFDLEKSAFLRYFIDKNNLYFASHHIIFDDVSWKIFIQHLINLLKSNNVTLPYNKLKFGKLQNNASSLKYWTEKLSNIDRTVNIQKIGSIMTKNKLKNVRRDLNLSIMKKLINYVIKNKISLNSFFMFAVSLIIYKITGEHRFVVATPVTVREPANNKIGCYINVIPCLINIDSSTSLIENLSAFASELWIDLEHRHFSLVELGKRLNIDHNLGLYNVMVEYTEVQPIEGVLSDEIVPNAKSKLDLIVSVLNDNKTPKISIEYNCGKVDERIVDIILNKIDFVIKQIISSEKIEVSNFSLINQKEKDQLINVGCGKITNLPFISIVENLLNKVDVSNKKIAIRHKKRSCSYDNLLSLINLYAVSLIDFGVSERDVVGLNMERSIEYIAMIFAIWRINAVYVPLDKNNPYERIKSFISQANIKTVVVDHEKIINGVNILNVKKLIFPLKNPKLPEINIKPDDTAYIIFTSGSTGTPKGVMIRHISLMNHINMMINKFSLGSNSVIAQTAPVSFDISVWQLVCALMIDGTIEICDKETLIDVEKMYSLIRNRKITILELVPSLLSEYLDAEQENTLLKGGLKPVDVITTGEAITKECAQKWIKSYPNKTLTNAYGPAEASDDTHFYDINTKSLIYNQIPIGKPLENVHTYIVDSDRKLCPYGVIGEICIGGIPVANGYVNDQNRTKSSFVDDIFLGHGKMYLTGDYGKWLPDGNLAYYGRRDHQVKICGQRFELGEIENTLMEINGIKDSAAIIKDYSTNKRVIGFVVQSKKDFISTEKILKLLHEKLPHYMIPWKIINIDVIPRNNNGKIDRSKLYTIFDSEQYFQNLDSDYSDKIKVICNIWSNVLRCKISTDTNFFDAGGDSLLSIKIVSMLNNQGIHVSVRDVFNAQTPEELAKVSNFQNDHFKTVKIIKKLPIQERYLSLAEDCANFGEIQTALITNNKLNKYNLNSVLKKISILYSSLKLKVINRITFVDNMDSVKNIIELYRRKLIIDKSMGIVIPLMFKDKVNILFIIHHYVFDIYSWNLLTDDIDKILKNKSIIKRSDHNLLKWWTRNCVNFVTKNKIYYKKSKKIDTKEHNFSYKLKNNIHFVDPTYMYYCVSKAIAQALKVSELNFGIEFSVRSLDKTGELSDSIGWGTYLIEDKVKVNEKFNEYKDRHLENLKDIYSGNYSNLVWTINYVGKLTRANDNCVIIKSPIYRKAPFVEIDIEIFNNNIIYSFQENINLEKRLMVDIFKNSSEQINQYYNDYFLNFEKQKEILKQFENSNKINIEKILPCLPSQHGFLIDTVSGNNQLYKQQLTVLINPKIRLNLKTLFSNINKVYEKSELLRTVFNWSTGKELQIILNGIEPVITKKSGKINELEKFQKIELNKLSDINSKPPIRFLIFTTKNGTYITVTYHHILLDGPSINKLLETIVTGNFNSVDNSIDKYVFWFNANVDKSCKKFWKNNFCKFSDDDIDVFGNLPTNTGPYVEKRDFKIFLKQVIKVSKKCKVTPSVLMQTIWSEWLIRYFNKESLTYGLVVSTREYGINDQCLGPFINTIPWNVTLNDDSLYDATFKTQEKIINMSLAKHLPLANISNSLSNNSLFFDVILTINTLPVDHVNSLYKVINTYENTGFPLSVDIDITANTLNVSFTSMIDNERLNLKKALNSFANYCKNRLINLKSTTLVKLSFQNNKQKDINNNITENLLKIYISKVLGIPSNKIRTDMSFILNGGDSILALKLKNYLKKDGFYVSIGNVIRTTKISELVNKIFVLDKQSKYKLSMMPCDYIKAPISISNILEAYKKGYGIDYHEQAGFYIKGILNEKVFLKAVNKLGKALSSLMVKYQFEPFYGYKLNPEARVEYKNIYLKNSNFKNFIKFISLNDINRPFNPEKGALLRVITCQNGSYWNLFLSFSALVTDGWSFSEMLEKLMSIYSSMLDNKKLKLKTDNSMYILSNVNSVVNNEKRILKAITKSKNIKELFYKMSLEECAMVDKLAKVKNITSSQLFEEIFSYVAKQIGIGEMLVYESGRDLDVDVTNSIGPFSYLRQKKLLSVAKNKTSIYYVFENYPRESENKLKSGKLPHFNEYGVWRRPLLPPESELGFVVDLDGGQYIISLLFRIYEKNDSEELYNPAILFDLMQKGIKIMMG